MSSMAKIASKDLVYYLVNGCITGTLKGQNI